MFLTPAAAQVLASNQVARASPMPATSSRVGPGDRRRVDQHQSFLGEAILLEHSSSV